MKNTFQHCKRLLALSVVCCLLIAAIGPVRAHAENISGHWAAGDIAFLMSKGIVQGDAQGNINPDKRITRAEFAATINRTFGFTEKGASNFPDVKTGSWYFDHMAIAKEAGYIQGDTRGNANPDKNITRAEAAVMLDRVLELPRASDDSPFEDQESFPGWSADSIGALHEQELIRGYQDNTFRAMNNITRAEAFAILARIFEQGLIDADDSNDGETPPASLGNIVFPALDGFERTVDSPDHVSYNSNSGSTIVISCEPAAQKQLEQAAAGRGPELSVLLSECFGEETAIVSEKVIDFPGLGRKGLEMELGITEEIFSLGLTIPSTGQIIIVLGVTFSEHKQELRNAMNQLIQRLSA